MEIRIKLEQKQKYDDDGWGYNDLDAVYLKSEEGGRVVLVINEREVCRLDINEMIKALDKLKDLS